MSIHENNQNQSKSNIKKIKSRKLINNNFVNITELKNDNDKNSRQINYAKLIKSLYRDLKIKDSFYFLKITVATILNRLILNI